MTTPNGQGFSDACAGYSIFSGLPNPGTGYTNTPAATHNCSTQTAPSASAVASYASIYQSGGNDYPFNNSSSAQSAPGFIKVETSNNAYWRVPFAGASADAGWNDQITITGGTGSAAWIVPLTVKGTLQVTGDGGLARLGIMAYRNNNTLTPYNTTLNQFSYNTFLSQNGGPTGIRNSVIAFSWEHQALWFGADDSLENYSVDRTVYFVFPFTYGQAFKVGFYMGGVVGERSCCPFTSANTAGFSFGNSLYWGGKGQVVNESNVVNPDFALSSSSGFDYSTAFVPEPSTFGLLACGVALGGLAYLRRGRGLKPTLHRK